MEADKTNLSGLHDECQDGRGHHFSAFVLGPFEVFLRPLEDDELGVSRRHILIEQNRWKIF